MKKTYILIIGLSVILLVLGVKSRHTEVSPTERVLLTDVRQDIQPVGVAMVKRPRQVPHVESQPGSATLGMPTNFPVELEPSWQFVQSYELKEKAELPNLTVPPPPAGHEELFSALQTGVEITPAQADSLLAKWEKPTAAELQSMSASHAVGGRMSEARKQLEGEIGVANTKKYFQWRQQNP